MLSFVKRHHVPNIVTAIGLFCGLYVIFRINMVEPGCSTYNIIFLSTLIMLIAAFSDVMDGIIARSLGEASAFGAAFDSLSDAVAFGIAPCLLVLKSLSVKCGTFLSFVIASGATVYAISSIVRLAIFTSNNIHNKNKSAHFRGLPITAAAIAIIAINLCFLDPIVESYLFERYEITTILLIKVITATSAFMLLGFFMVSRLQFPSIQRLTAVVHRIPNIIGGALLLLSCYFLIFYFAMVLTFIAWSYVLFPLFVKMRS